MSFWKNPDRCEASHTIGGTGQPEPARTRCARPRARARSREMWKRHPAAIRPRGHYFWSSSISRSAFRISSGLEPIAISVIFFMRASSFSNLFFSRVS